MRPQQKQTAQNRSYAWIYWLIAIAIVSVGTLELVYSNESAELPELKARANRIFSYDKTHKGHLSFNQLAALSVALEFRDYRGAKILIYSLEQSLQETR